MGRPDDLKKVSAQKTSTSKTRSPKHHTKPLKSGGSRPITEEDICPQCTDYIVSLDKEGDRYCQKCGWREKSFDTQKGVFSRLLEVVKFGINTAEGLSQLKTHLKNSRQSNGHITDVSISEAEFTRLAQVTWRAMMVKALLEEAGLDNWVDFALKQMLAAQLGRPSTSK
jgi:hypothetical protein